MDTVTVLPVIIVDPNKAILVHVPPEGTGAPVLEKEYEYLMVTRLVSVPCLVVMFLSSVFLIYIIMRHLKSLLFLYVSVLFYAAAQVFLVCVIVVSWNLPIDPSASSVECYLPVTLQSVSLVLPVHALLIITVVRTIFVMRPFDNHLILKIRYQLIGVLLIFLIVGGIFSLPYLGVCGISLKQGPQGPYCTYNSGTDPCTIFTGTAVLVGYLLPVVLVLVLYGVIYSTVVRARKNSRQMTISVSSYASDWSAPAEKSRARKLSEKVGRSIPWCILALLGLYLISTVPWVPMDLYCEQFMLYLQKGPSSVMAVDIMYSVLFIASALSPLIYLISANTLKGLVVLEIKKLWGCIMCRGKYHRVSL